MRYTTDESDYWQSSQVYTSSAPAGAPSVSFGIGTNGDVLAVPMSSRRSSRERYLQPSWRSTGVANLQGFSRSANSTGMLSHPSLQGGDGGRLFTHMSSSQTMKSFGGGNSSAGVSVSGGVVSTNNFTTSSPNNLITSSPNTPLTSSPNSLITSSPTSLLALSPNSLITSSPLAANYQGLGNATIGDPRGISGRKNAGPSTNTGGWLNWLVLNGYGTQGADGIWGLDIYELRKAYEAYVSAWNLTMGGDQPPTWDEWLSWFMGSEDSPYGWTDDGGDTYSYYKYIPVGDATLLILFALLYTVVLIIRRKKATLS